MQGTNVVVILAGVYASYSTWIQREIRLAQQGFSQPKPIVAVRPWANQRISAVVQGAADRVVGWNTGTIVGAIRELVR